MPNRPLWPCRGLHAGSSASGHWSTGPSVETVSGPEAASETGSGSEGAVETGPEPEAAVETGPGPKDWRHLCRRHPSRLGCSSDRSVVPYSSSFLMLLLFFSVAKSSLLMCSAKKLFFNFIL